MSGVTPDQLRNWIEPRLDSFADAEYAERMQRLAPCEGPVIGVRTSDLRELAREAGSDLNPDPMEWCRYLSTVMPMHHRELILFGLLGLDRNAQELDDLFGERAGGWARELTSWEVTDALASVVGWWVLADMSRLGYLEAWAVRGENLWKKRLAAMATIVLNTEGNSYPAQTFQVLRNLMTTEEQPLAKAVGAALREVGEIEPLLRYLAWWAPRCSKPLLQEALKNLDNSQREQILALA